jgi:hypothetical protein
VASELLTTREAAHRLGVTVTTLYGWLGLSDVNALVIRGRPVTIQYLQGGPRGQGRIRIATDEVERLLELMRVIPSSPKTRREPSRRVHFPGITVPLGRPEES